MQHYSLLLNQANFIHIYFM